ncbi:MAG: hypothetical protein IT379_38985 [Deltaproteobacteria bacterium]|nr:hypothetical protein [Deltaproteobacteria bacterium]
MPGRCFRVLRCVALVLVASCGDDDGIAPPDATNGDTGDGAPVDPCPIPGQMPCRGVCIDTTSDDDNCGFCGARCPSTESCVQGICRVVACEEAPLAMCGSECVDTRVHPSHCGGCGQACVLGEVCDSGTCRCTTGRTRCDGRCVDLASDDEHCGGCGIACAAPERCRGWACERPCGGWGIECDGVCVSPDDPASCGGCGIRCFAGVPCIGRSCGGCGDRVACAEGCRDLTEPTDCGQCGFRAPLGSACVDGTAVCAEGHRACGADTGTTLVCVRTSDAMDCDACDGGAACTEGTYCVAGACTSATSVGLRAECGGPYVAGSSAVQCHAYLELEGLGEIDVTTSPYVLWLTAGCDGDACPPFGGTDEPTLVEGTGDTPSAGLFTPSGAVNPSRITAGTVVYVVARYVRDATEHLAETMVFTAPVP